jgi:hypothetical protein
MTPAKPSSGTEETATAGTCTASSAAASPSTPEIGGSTISPSTRERLAKATASAIASAPSGGVEWTISSYPCAAVTETIPRWMESSTSALRSLWISPIRNERRIASARARRLGRKRSAAIAASIRSRVWALTLGDLLSTRETVRIETPAAAATSSMVGSPWRAGSGWLGTFAAVIAAF